MFEDVSIVTVALIACSGYVVYWYMFKSRRYSPPLPPSPRFSLPWIGHLYLFKPDMRKCFREFKKKYGDIFSMQFGNRPMVVLSSYRVIKEAFRTNGDRFPLRPELPLLDRVTRKLGKYLIVNVNRYEYLSKQDANMFLHWTRAGEHSNGRGNKVFIYTINEMYGSVLNNSFQKI